MTEFVQYHEHTEKIALFVSDGLYWIGRYDKHSIRHPHQPPYVHFDGVWNTKEEGLMKLSSVPGEFDDAGEWFAH
jgi:hypothetical protein